mmetsp:Transcript_7485/g.45994  ORF Transcript_7485/g.45994 Transcript_7485/m.45994 type:complete len:443 (-) Transcript_7485:91-1419(-)
MDEGKGQAVGRGSVDAAMKPDLQGQFSDHRASKSICVWKGVDIPDLNEGNSNELNDEIASACRLEGKTEISTSSPATKERADDQHLAMHAQTYEKHKRKAFGILRKAQVDRNYLEAYKGTGRRTENVNRFVPEAEILKAEHRLEQYKESLRECIRNCDEAEGNQKVAALAPNSSGENSIDVEEVCCSFCGSGDSCPGNDIIICDGYCERAYHQKCIVPAVCLEGLSEDQGWLCPPCQAKVDIVFRIDDVFDVHYDASTPWHTMFQKELNHVGDDVEGEQQQVFIMDMDLPSEDEEDEDFECDNEAGTSSNSDGSFSEESASGQDGSTSKATSTEEEAVVQIARKRGMDATAQCTGRRKRSKVDYQALAESMFGWGEAYAGEGLDSEDEAWHPGSKTGTNKSPVKAVAKEKGAKVKKVNGRTRRKVATHGASPAPKRVARKRK